MNKNDGCHFDIFGNPTLSSRSSSLYHALYAAEPFSWWFYPWSCSPKLFQPQGSQVPTSISSLSPGRLAARSRKYSHQTIWLTKTPISISAIAAACPQGPTRPSRENPTFCVTPGDQQATSQQTDGGEWAVFGPFSFSKQMELPVEEILNSQDVTQSDGKNMPKIEHSMRYYYHYSAVMAALRLATPSNKPMYRWSAVYDLEIIIRLRQGCSFKVQTWHEWFELQDFDHVTRLKKKTLPCLQWINDRIIMVV